MENDTLQNYLNGIIAGIVSYPDDIQIDRLNDEMGVLYTVRVHADDRGKILGKRGVTATAIRTLMRIAGFKQNARVSIKIDVPGSTFEVRTE